jgi:Abortive infection alpha
MGDNSLIPISDEQAKLGQELVKAVRDASGYFTDILGDIPKDLLGLLIGDRVKANRLERIAILWQQTRERLRDRGIGDPEPPSLKYAIPILQAAADEENEELQDLWSRLLAAAMDPKRRDAMRQSFVETVKRMDPMDALVLKLIAKNGDGTWHPSGRQAVAGSLSCSQDEVSVSFHHLAKLDCVYFTDSTGPRIMPYLSPFGKLLTYMVRGRGP